MKTVNATVDVDNYNSMNLMDRLGFKMVGEAVGRRLRIDGFIHDQYKYQLDL